MLNAIGPQEPAPLRVGTGIVAVLFVFLVFQYVMDTAIRKGSDIRIVQPYV